jgi:hypothetical protein
MHLNTSKEYFLGCEYIYRENQTSQCEELWPNTRSVPSQCGAWKHKDKFIRAKFGVLAVVLMKSEVFWNMRRCWLAIKTFRSSLMPPSSVQSNFPDDFQLQTYRYLYRSWHTYDEVRASLQEDELHIINQDGNASELLRENHVRHTSSWLVLRPAQAVRRSCPVIADKNHDRKCYTAQHSFRDLLPAWETSPSPVWLCYQAATHCAITRMKIWERNW